MNSSENWYKTFFNGSFLHFWVKAIKPEQTEAEIKFIKEVVSLPTEANILDVPCGFGRHSIALAKENYKLTSLDIAEGYINSLNEIKNKEGLPITTIQADILEHDLKGSFDLAICFGNSFSYFSYYPLLLFAKKVSNVLKAGGTFIINTGALAESLLPSIVQNTWVQLEDIIILFERKYHTDASVLQSDYQIIKEGKIEKGTAFHYVFTLAEIKRLLTEAGFHEIVVYSDLNKSDYKIGDRQVYIIARK